MELERFALFAKRAMSREVSDLPTDLNESVVVLLGDSVVSANRVLIFLCPICSSQITDCRSGDDFRLQDGEMNEYMLSPAKECVDRGVGIPLVFRSGRFS